MTLRRARDSWPVASRSDVVARLRAAGCVFAEDEAVLLLAQASTPAELDALLARRVAGEPLEYVLGWAEFRGLRIAVTAGVFVPRRRTSFLVDLAAGSVGGSGAAGAVVLDLCCGAGAIGAALAHEQPGLELHLADVDPAAVECARRNTSAYGACCYVGDLYDALPSTLRGRFDVIVVNAPYVPSGEIELMPREAREYERRAALDGGGDGLDPHRRIATGAPTWLAARGALLIETSLGQAAACADIFRDAGLSSRVAHRKDDDATVVVATAFV